MRYKRNYFLLFCVFIGICGCQKSTPATPPTGGSFFACNFNQITTGIDYGFRSGYVDVSTGGSSCLMIVQAPLQNLTFTLSWTLPAYSADTSFLISINPQSIAAMRSVPGTISLVSYNLDGSADSLFTLSPSDSIGVSMEISDGYLNGTFGGHLFCPAAGNEGSCGGTFSAQL